MTKKKNEKRDNLVRKFSLESKSTRLTVAANPDRVERTDEDCWIVLLLLRGVVLVNWFYSLLLMIIFGFFQWH